MANYIRKKTSQEYKDIFDREITRNRTITIEDKKEKIVITDDEEWKQCYKQGDKILEQLPKFWFVSDKCNLISVSSGKAYLVRKIKKCKDRYCYKFIIGMDGDKPIFKNIQCHNLTRLVFGGKSYGNADKLLEEDGLYSFSINGLQGHHIGDRTDNSPGNNELLLAKPHRLVTRGQRLNRNNVEDVDNFLIDFELMASEEEPNKISVLFPGHKVDKKTLEIINDNEIKLLDTMYSQNNVKFTEQALNQMKSIRIIINAIDLLIDKYGIDFFEESKYLLTRDKEYLFYKCEHIENELSITEINQLSELINKDYILCYLNEDNKLECYIDNVQKDEVNNMNYDFKIEDRQIIVNNKYYGMEQLNNYFTYHKLKCDNYSMDKVMELIESVAFMLDGVEDNSDCIMIEEMLEE